MKEIPSSELFGENFEYFNNMQSNLNSIGLTIVQNF